MEDLIIEEDYITFETAKLAKEKGFGWEHRIFKSRRTGELVDQKSELFPEITIQPGVIASSHVEYCFNEDGKVISPKLFNLKNSHYPRPTQALLQKWLRKVHNINVDLYLTGMCYYCYLIQTLYNKEGKSFQTKKDSIQFDELFQKPEEAFEEGLKQALKLI